MTIFHLRFMNYNYCVLLCFWCDIMYFHSEIKALHFNDAFPSVNLIKRSFSIGKSAFVQEEASVIREFF